MKPTKNQIETINTIVSIIKTWTDSNDITSPTHFVDIHEYLNADLEDKIEPRIIDTIDSQLRSMLNTIRYINIEYEREVIKTFTYDK